MKRTEGSKGLSLVECINPKLRKYRVRWDIQPSYNEEGEEQGVSFVEEEFLHTPTLLEIKETILSWMNRQIDNIICSGYTWKGMAVWLSAENQFNYKAAYDLAVQTEGQSLPVLFKFGATDNPEYYEFTDLQELQEFYIGAIDHISKALKDGWQAKDSVDWNLYEKTLKEICLTLETTNK